MCPPTARADWIIYTDASSISEIIAAVAFKGTPAGFKSASEAFSAKVPSVWKHQSRCANRIYGFELLAPVAFLWTWRRGLAGKKVIIFIDNNAALSALIRGDSVSGIAAALVAAFWFIAHEANICIWLARVSSKLNVAGLPTRYRKILSQNKPTLKFKNLFQLLPASLRWRVVV